MVSILACPIPGKAPRGYRYKECDKISCRSLESVWVQSSVIRRKLSNTNQCTQCFGESGVRSYVKDDEDGLQCVWMLNPGMPLWRILAQSRELDYDLTKSLPVPQLLDAPEGDCDMISLSSAARRNRVRREFTDGSMRRITPSIFISSV